MTLSTFAPAASLFQAWDTQDNKDLQPKLAKEKGEMLAIPFFQKGRKIQATGATLVAAVLGVVIATILQAGVNGFVGNATTRALPVSTATKIKDALIAAFSPSQLKQVGLWSLVKALKADPTRADAASFGQRVFEWMMDNKTFIGTMACETVVGTILGVREYRRSAEWNARDKQRTALVENADLELDKAAAILMDAIARQEAFEKLNTKEHQERGFAGKFSEREALAAFFEGFTADEATRLCLDHAKAKKADIEAARSDDAALRPDAVRFGATANSTLPEVKAARDAHAALVTKLQAELNDTLAQATMSKAELEALEAALVALRATDDDALTEAKIAELDAVTVTRYRTALAAMKTKPEGHEATDRLLEAKQQQQQLTLQGLVRKFWKKPVRSITLDQAQNPETIPFIDGTHVRVEGIPGTHTVKKDADSVSLTRNTHHFNAYVAKLQRERRPGYVFRALNTQGKPTLYKVTATGIANATETELEQQQQRAAAFARSQTARSVAHAASRDLIAAEARRKAALDKRKATAANLRTKNYKKPEVSDAARLAEETAKAASERAEAEKNARKPKGPKTKILFITAEQATDLGSLSVAAYPADAKIKVKGQQGTFTLDRSGDVPALKPITATVDANADREAEDALRQEQQREREAASLLEAQQKVAAKEAFRSTIADLISEAEIAAAREQLAGLGDENGELGRALDEQAVVIAQAAQRAAHEAAQAEQRAKAAAEELRIRQISESADQQATHLRNTSGCPHGFAFKGYIDGVDGQVDLYVDRSEKSPKITRTAPTAPAYVAPKPPTPPAPIDTPTIVYEVNFGNDGKKGRAKPDWQVIEIKGAFKKASGLPNQTNYEDCDFILFGDEVHQLQDGKGWVKIAARKKQ